MNELLLIVSLVTMLQGGKPLGTTTGFFYLKNDVLYFVTNRHVVIDEQKGLKPDALQVRLHSDPNDLTRNIDRTIELYRGGKPFNRTADRRPAFVVTYGLRPVGCRRLTSLGF